MTRADIIKAIADEHYKLADLYLQLANDSPPVSGVPDAAGAGFPPAMPPAAPVYEASPFEEDFRPEEIEAARQQVANASAPIEQGSEAVCPKHRIPFSPGTYGPYCKQKTDDAAWGKQKGDTMWCRITPKNAAEYLRIKAAA